MARTKKTSASNPLLHWRSQRVSPPRMQVSCLPPPVKLQPVSRGHPPVSSSTSFLPKTENASRPPVTASSSTCPLPNAAVTPSSYAPPSVFTPFRSVLAPAVPLSSLRSPSMRRKATSYLELSGSEFREVLVDETQIGGEGSQLEVKNMVNAHGDIENPVIDLVEPPCSKGKRKARTPSPSPSILVSPSVRESPVPTSVSALSKRKGKKRAKFLDSDSIQAVPEETKEISANDAAQRRSHDLWSASSQKYLGILKTSFDEGLSFTFASPAAALMDKGNSREGSSQLEGVAIERKKEKKD